MIEMVSKSVVQSSRSGWPSSDYSWQCYYMLGTTKVRGPNLGHFFSSCLPINGTLIGKQHNGSVRMLQALYFLHSKFEVQSPQDTQERSDFVHVVHIANLGGGGA